MHFHFRSKLLMKNDLNTQLITFGGSPVKAGSHSSICENRNDTEIFLPEDEYKLQEEFSQLRSVDSKSPSLSALKRKKSEESLSATRKIKLAKNRESAAKSRNKKKLKLKKAFEENASLKNERSELKKQIEKFISLIQRNHEESSQLNDKMEQLLQENNQLSKKFKSLQEQAKTLPPIKIKNPTPTSAFVPNNYIGAINPYTIPYYYPNYSHVLTPPTISNQNFAEGAKNQLNN